MKTRVLSPKSSPFSVPIGPDVTNYGRGREFVPGYQYDKASPGGGPGPAQQSIGLAGARTEFKGYSPQETAQRQGMAASGQFGGRMMGNEFYPIDPYKGSSPSPFSSPTAGGPVSAVNPQLAGLAAGVNAIHDQNAAIAARPPGPSYIQRQLAATTPPQQQGIGLAGPAQSSATPPMPLANYPTNQGQFAQGMARENPMGAWFGGALPVRGPDGRPTFASGPERDMSQKPQFGMDSGASGRFSSVTNGDGSTQYVGMPTPAAKAASDLFGARRGGPAARQEAYQGRVASEASQRSSGVLAAAKARGANRAENVRQRRGQLTFDERLAQQDPQAAAQRAYGQGQLGLAREQGSARIASEKERTAAAERMATAGNASREKIAGLGLAKAGVDPVTGKPIDTRTDAEKIAGAGSLDLAGKTPEERKKMVADLPPETQQRLLQEQDLADRGFFGQPIAGTGAPGKAPITRGEAIQQGLLGLAQLDPLTKPRPNKKAEPNPGPRPGWRGYIGMPPGF